MLNENEVVDYVCKYLVEEGWTINQCLGTTQKGIDIIAEKEGKSIPFEVKGATSSIEKSSRYLKPFNRNQVKHHVAMALYKCSEVLTENHFNQVCIALPDDDLHREMVMKISDAIERLTIDVYFVNIQGEISIS